jgi:hypothetical protein
MRRRTEVRGEVSQAAGVLGAVPSSSGRVRFEGDERGEAVSKPRVTTDEECKELADWWWSLKQMGTVRDKAKELGVSIPALYDSIKRGLQQPTAGQRFKLSQYQRDVSRETIHSESNGDAA